jgi:hypothetical protein
MGRPCHDAPVDRTSRRFEVRTGLWLSGAIIIIVGAHAAWSGWSAVDQVRAEQSADLRLTAEVVATAMVPVLRKDGRLSAGHVVMNVRSPLPGGGRWWRPTLEAPSDFTSTPEDWRLLLDKQTAFHRFTADAHRYFVPIVVNEEVRGVLMLAQTLERRQARLRAVLLQHGVLAFVLVLVGLGLLRRRPDVTPR